MSIVQLSRFFSLFFSSDSFYVLSKAFLFVKNFFIFLFRLIWNFHLRLQRQLVYTITFRSFCQQLFLIDFQSFQSLPTRNVPPPRLLCSSVLLLLSVLFLSDECYLTMPVLNCQYFLYFSCNSEYSDNSFCFCKTISFTIITDTALYSRKFFRSQKNPHAFGRMHTDFQF